MEPMMISHNEKIYAAGRYVSASVKIPREDFLSRNNSVFFFTKTGTKMRINRYIRPFSERILNKVLLGMQIFK